MWYILSQLLEKHSLFHIICQKFSWTRRYFLCRKKNTLAWFFLKINDKEDLELGVYAVTSSSSSSSSSIWGALDAFLIQIVSSMSLVVVSHRPCADGLDRLLSSRYVRSLGEESAGTGAVSVAAVRRWSVLAVVMRRVRILGAGHNATAYTTSTHCGPERSKKNKKDDNQ